MSPPFTRVWLIRCASDPGGVLQRRYVYDIEPGDVSRWVLLRDTSSRATLTVTEIESDAIGGTRETETEVGDFETTNALSAELGYTPKAYQENRRHSFTLDGSQLEIDTWPRIPALLGYGEAALMRTPRRSTPATASTCPALRICASIPDEG